MGQCRGLKPNSACVRQFFLWQGNPSADAVNPNALRTHDVIGLLQFPQRRACEFHPCLNSTPVCSLYNRIHNLLLNMLSLKPCVGLLGLTAGCGMNPPPACIHPLPESNPHIYRLPMQISYCMDADPLSMGLYAVRLPPVGYSSRSFSYPNLLHCPFQYPDPSIALVA